MEQEDCGAFSVRGLQSSGARLRAIPIWLDGLNAHESTCLGTHRHTCAHSNGSAGTWPTSGTNTAYQSPTSSQAAHSNIMTHTKARGKKNEKKKKKKPAVKKQDNQNQEMENVE